MHKAKLINPITYMMETNPNSAAAAAAAAAAPDPSRSAPPAAAAESDTVLTRDIDGTSSSSAENHRHFPDTHIVIGRARHPQSQGGIERSNALFKTGLFR